MSVIREYYDALAKNYDQNRFGNSYGRYIDTQEREILTVWLAHISAKDVIDIGCGTGRLLDFAMTGADESPKMLEVATAKYIDRHLICASLPYLHSLKGTYQAGICFHVFMHLSKPLIGESLQTLAQIIPQGGKFIFDIPSKHRRLITSRGAGKSGWHGNTAAGFDEITQWIGPYWSIAERRGVLFFPMHRMPQFMRAWFHKLDSFIGSTPLARYSSYHVYLLERV